MNQTVQDVSLYSQLFPMATIGDFVGTAHQALTAISVPAYKGSDIYAVLQTLRRQQQATLDFAYSPDRKPFTNSISAAQPEIEERAKNIKDYEMAMAGWPAHFDSLDFLHWPHPSGSGYPAFMVLDVFQEHFSQTVFKTFERSDWNRRHPKLRHELFPQLPSEVHDQYGHFNQQIASHLSHDDEGKVFIASRFEGEPPESTDQKINNAITSGHITQTLIAAEAEIWTVNVTVTAKKDPIVIGVAPVLHPITGHLICNQYYFIDIFYPKKMELKAIDDYLKHLSK